MHTSRRLQPVVHSGNTAELKELCSPAQPPSTLYIKLSIVARAASQTGDGWVEGGQMLRVKLKAEHVGL